MKKSVFFFIVATYSAQTMAQAEKVFQQESVKHDLLDETREHPIHLTKHIQYDLSKGHAINFNTHNSSPVQIISDSKKLDNPHKKSIPKSNFNKKKQIKISSQHY